MDINYDLDLGGYHVELKETFDESTAPRDPMDHIKKRVEQAKANGIGAYKRPAYQGGGRNGNGNHAPEAWAKAKGVRCFTYPKDGSEKKALEFELEPEAGTFKLRTAMAWDPEPMLGTLPAALKAAIETGWADKATKGGAKLAIDGAGIEVGFYTDGDKLKAVAIRMAGSTTDQKVMV